MFNSSSNIEYGSFYHSAELIVSPDNWLHLEDALVTSCGRDSLYLSILCLKQEAQRKGSLNAITLWIPSYYCHSVTESLTENYDVRIYNHTPEEPVLIAQELTENDVLILVEYFGQSSDVSFIGTPFVLLDKTHYPLSSHRYDFCIDYEFGSLRKMLPVADGGYVLRKSRRAPPLIQLNVTEHHSRVFDLVHSGRKMKLDYLQRLTEDKSEYLDLFSRAEKYFGSIFQQSAPRTIGLEYADIQYYVSRRKRNSAALLKNINLEGHDISIFSSDIYFCLKFSNSTIRESAKKYLVKNDVYPAVFWPVDIRYMNQESIDFSDRVLFFPNDFRYDEGDMLLISNILNAFLRQSNV